MPDAPKRGRGRPRTDTQPASVRLPRDLYDAWKASGRTLPDLIRAGLRSGIDREE